MGGVWFGAEKHLYPMVWGVQWPKDITDAFVSGSTMNPKGHLANSDLEMARVLLQEAVLEAALGLTMMINIQSAMGCDNLSVVA
jgi:hypothetical protein